MTEVLRVAIVDDEPLAREGLRLRLSAIADVEVAGEFGVAQEAVAGIDELSPDVLFLDVEMPELDGFELLDRLASRALPVVVFVTAFSEYAVEAFRAGALDYLVKPYDDESLGRCVERARERVAIIRAARRTAAIAPYPARMLV